VVFFLTSCLFISVGLISFLIFKLYHLFDLNNQNLREYLELATNDQLIRELRHRPKFPHVMIYPVMDDEYVSGFKIESHNIASKQDKSLYLTLKILSIAQKTTIHQLRKNNVEIPPEFLSSEEE